MKAIVYSTKKNEKQSLMNANNGKHELTWLSLPLKSETVRYASGNQAVVIFTNDDASCSIIAKLAGIGIKYIATRSAGTDHIDFDATGKHHIQVRNIPGYSPFAVAEHAVALALALNRHLILSNQNCRNYDFSLNGLTGFNLHGKTVGIVGLGHIGKVTAGIFRGFGCKVLGYDIDPAAGQQGVKRVKLDDLLNQSDIISLHVPLKDETLHMIRQETIEKMKDGVMLINTARGGLVNTVDIINALDAGKIGYFGADVYEFEGGLFFEDHEADWVRDALLTQLMDHPNVLVTPHQAFLTVEALVEIAAQTIDILDQWENHTLNIRTV